MLGGEEPGWLWGICSHKGHGQSGSKGRHFPPHPHLFPSQKYQQHKAKRIGVKSTTGLYYMNYY